MEILNKLLKNENDQKELIIRGYNAMLSSDMEKILFSLFVYHFSSFNIINGEKGKKSIPQFFRFTLGKKLDYIIYYFSKNHNNEYKELEYNFSLLKKFNEELRNSLTHSEIVWVDNTNTAFNFKSVTEVDGELRYLISEKVFNYNELIEDLIIYKNTLLDLSRKLDN